MGTIRSVSCNDCGDVELAIEDVKVRICEDTNQGQYNFKCPCCNMVTVKEAEARTIDLLVASGCENTTWRLPAELKEEKSGEPIDSEDQIAFQDTIYNDEAFKTALRELTRKLSEGPAYPGEGEFGQGPEFKPPQI